MRWLVLLGCVLLVGCSTTPLRNAGDICSIYEQKRSWYRASVAASKKWNQPVWIPMAIMRQESGFKARAKPPRKRYFGFIPGPRKSSAYGFAQVLDGTWRDYQRATGNYRGTRRKFRDAVDFIHWYNATNSRKNGIAGNDTYNLYLGYHEGVTGFRRKSYQQKPALMTIARNVKRQADVYQQQYQNCRQSLSRGWFRRFFGL